MLSFCLQGISLFQCLEQPIIVNWDLTLLRAMLRRVRGLGKRQKPVYGQSSPRLIESSESTRLL